MNGGTYRSRNWQASNSTGSAILSQDQIIRFVNHFERLTRHTLEEMPERADVVLHLAGNHQFESAQGL